jgi:hypothetical protein
VALAGDVSIDTGNGLGAVVFAGSLDGNKVLSVRAGRFVVASGAGIRTALQSLTVDGASEIGEGVTTTLDQTYGGALQLLSDLTFTGRQLTFDGSIDGGQALVLNSAEVTQINGAVGQSTMLSSLTTAATGATTINASLIATTGRQLYNNPLTFTSGSLASPLVLRSTLGDVDLSSTVSAGTDSKSATRSLNVEALAGDVYVRDQIGVNLNGVPYSSFQGSTDVNPYALSMKAADIWLLADVTTFETQIYDGRVHIGNNGSNGSTRLLVSMDPSITFVGSIDDTIPNTHTLDARAVTASVALGEIPRIRFGGDIGRGSRLLGLKVSTGVQQPDLGAGVGDIVSAVASRLGLISLEGNVSTMQDQSYVTGSVAIGTDASGPVTLSSDMGKINMLVRNGVGFGLIRGEKLKFVLGPGASLGFELGELISPNGLSAEDLDGALATRVANSAGAILNLVDTDVVAQAGANNIESIAAPSLVLFETEVEIGNVQSLDCGITAVEVLLTCGFEPS